MIRTVQLTDFLSHSDNTIELNDNVASPTESPSNVIIAIGPSPGAIVDPEKFLFISKSIKMPLNTVTVRLCLPYPSTFVRLASVNSMVTSL